MIDNLKSIKISVIYGDENRNNSLKAYKAERELVKAINSNRENIEKFFNKKYNISTTFKHKKLESTEKEEYSLIELINNKLINSNVSITLNTYDIYKENGIEEAVDQLYFKSIII